MSELGDITGLLEEGAGAPVSDLEWLAVDDEKYRQEDRLPKQNLDMVPDLRVLWDHEREESQFRLLPNTGPKTMGDLSQEHGPLRASPELILRTARLAIMQYDDPIRIREALASRFDADSLRAVRGALAGVLAERGLLGRYYVAAQDFPECSQGRVAFADKFAATARFVLPKRACADCTHCTKSADGRSHCGVFHKQLELPIPYTPELAAEVERLQLAKGRAVQASVQDPKERVRHAYLAERVSRFTGITSPAAPQSSLTFGQAAGQLIAVDSLVRKKREAAAHDLAASKARPIVAMVRREMLKGRSQEEVVQSLRLSFDLRDLQASQAHWKPVVNQLGLYGVVYSTQDSFEDCHEGADLLAKHGSSVRAIVAGAKCGSCIYQQVGRCLMYGRRLVASASEVLTAETVKQVVDEHKMAGRLPWNADRMEWGQTPVQALRAIHKAAAGPQVAESTAPRLTTETMFTGGSRAYQANSQSVREVVRACARYMNEGLYGTDLAAVLKSRFDPRDLYAARHQLRTVLAEQGLAGIQYVDPTIYDDYGHGCREAGRLHRTRLVRWVKMGSACGSCTLRDPTGTCSVLNKRLVEEPPYVDRVAEQAAVLASGRATTVSYADLMNNGLSMMAEYEIQNRPAADILLTAEAAHDPGSIEFGGVQVDL